MPQCKKCGKKGWLLKLERETGLCLSCNAVFVENGRQLTEKITENVNLIAESDDPKTIVSRCDQIEETANKLISLHKGCFLEPSAELLDVVNWCREVKERALGKIHQ